MDDNSQESLKPLTFKVSTYMHLRMEELIEAGHYENKAELIRQAIQKLIEWELSIPSILPKFEK